MTFKKWFEYYGNSLLIGYQRAKTDGNKETFTDWVLGEHDVYLRDGKDYEVAYNGLLDSNIHKEKIELEIEIESGVLQNVRLVNKEQAKRYDLEYKLIDHDI